MTDQEVVVEVPVTVVVPLPPPRPDSPHPSVVSDTSNNDDPLSPAVSSSAAERDASHVDEPWRLRLSQQQQSSLRLSAEPAPPPLITASTSLQPGGGVTILWSAEMSENSSVRHRGDNSNTNVDSSVLTTWEPAENNLNNSTTNDDSRHSSSNPQQQQQHQQQRRHRHNRRRRGMPVTWHRRWRSLVRCACFPVMILSTVVALCLFFFFIVFPLMLFLTGLLAVYYCCTTDPIPFRTLLRAMVGVDDWNGGAFDSVTPGGEPYNVTKEDIRKGIIRRLCLGPHEFGVVNHTSEAAAGTVQENKDHDDDNAIVPENDIVGGDLSTLPRDHPGRVHWKNEASAITCLVFSEPLGSSSSVVSDPAEEEGQEPSPTSINHNNNNLSSSAHAETLQQHDESVIVVASTKIPKYLQQHRDIEEGKPEIIGQEEESSEGRDEATTSAEKTAGEKQSADPSNAHNRSSSPPAEQDASSVRDRGTVCDICLLEFETGEAVAWSPNPACDHAYHEDCITDWLLRKPTCPSCRQNFIILPTAATTSSSIQHRLDNSIGESTSDSSSSEGISGSGIESVLVHDVEDGSGASGSTNNRRGPSDTTTRIRTGIIENDTEVSNVASSETMTSNQVAGGTEVSGGGNGGGDIELGNVANRE